MWPLIHAPESVMPIPKSKPARMSTQLTGPICALGGKYSVDVSGRNCPKRIAYPMLPTAIAMRTDKNGVVFLSSIASRKIQKKQKRARSKIRPRAAPISSEKDACDPVPSLPERRYATPRRDIARIAAVIVR
jgi:hypothetical protein